MHTLMTRPKVIIDEKESYSLAIFHLEPAGAPIDLPEVGALACQHLRWILEIMAINRD